MAKLRMKSWVGWITIVALVLMMMGVPVIPGGQAVSFTNVKDTISDSDLGVDANHTIQFMISTALTASSTITLKFDDTGDTFNLTGLANTDVEDYDIATTSDFTLVASGGCTNGSTTIQVKTVNTTNDEIEFQLCWAASTIPANTTTTIEIGTNAGGNTQINNPDSAGSYKIRVETKDVNSTVLDRADAMVAIIDDVVVTATVSATLTFTVSGVATSTSVNGTITNASTTATTIPFGTLTVGATSTAAQNLYVTTNADDGFTVNIFQNQNLTNAGGSDIDCFRDGTCVSVPEAWGASPLGTLDTEATYGHFGITSEDSTLGTNCASDDFGATLWAGFSGTTQDEVMCHTGPADGSTAHIGATRVGFQVQITALQEAGDYTNTLTYIATPTY